MVISLKDVLADPAAAGRVLEAELFGVQVTRQCPGMGGGVLIDLTFTPPAELVAFDYAPERACVSIRPDGRIFTFPVGPPRTWKHRERFWVGNRPATSFGAHLCLFYAGDPRSLRWEWVDGLEQYVGRVHRHLFYEEYARRHNGEWPVEDAPHGHPASGVHPIVSEQMRREATRWVA